MNKVSSILSSNNSPLLLHVCCAPCSGGIIQTLVSCNIDFAIFFYNPNIHPKTEYLKRKKEIIRYLKKFKITFFDGDYEIGVWNKITKNYKNEPERGERCRLCFRLRLEKTAELANNKNFKSFTTSISISRWKSFEMICSEGKRAAKKYSDLYYLDSNWRLNNGSQLMYQVAKDENFYMQKYCGCLYSI